MGAEAADEMAGLQAEVTRLQTELARAMQARGGGMTAELASVAIVGAEITPEWAYNTSDMELLRAGVFRLLEDLKRSMAATKMYKEQARPESGAGASGTAGGEAGTLALVATNSDLKAQVEQLQQQLKAVEDKYAVVQSEKKGLEKEVEQLRSEKEGLEKKVEELEGEAEGEKGSEGDSEKVAKEAEVPPAKRARPEAEGEAAASEAPRGRVRGQGVGGRGGGRGAESQRVLRSGGETPVGAPEAKGKKPKK